MLKDEVIKFLNDNGEKLIVGGYANYLDLKRKKMLKFDNDTFVNMAMQQYFISTLKRKFGRQVETQFMQECFNDGKYDVQYATLKFRYEQLRQKHFDNDKSHVINDAKELIKKIDNIS